MVTKLYPGGKSKAVNFSYDDGVTQDVLLVEMLNNYGMKGTFNLNSRLLLDGFTWEHPCGKTIRRLPQEQIVSLYEGHEIASHSATHPMMDSLDASQILEEMVSDRETLKEIFGREVLGFALPFTYHDERVYHCSKQAGFAYARISDVNPDFSVPTDFHTWRGTLFHLDDRMDACVDRFLKTDKELAIFQPIGHSYDLEVDGKWEWFEAMLRKLSADESIWPATHIEIVQYLQNMEKAVISKQEILNCSQANLWFCVNGRNIILKPGEKEIIR